MTTVRLPAVAGRFYPADPGQLASLVDSLLAGAPEGPPATAYVVPHAGLRFSGSTAAHAYARLRGDSVARVVLVGPAHYVPLEGCAVSTADVWLSPLGDQPLDRDGAQALADGGLVVADDRPHQPEHSLEVHLPFLRKALRPGVPLLPVLIGRSTVDDATRVIRAALTLSSGSVLLCSTDLSHYLADQAAREQDARTAAAILDLAPERVGVRDACGVFALRGTLGWARQDGRTATQLHLCTSADLAGQPERVVGYGAFAFQ